MFYAEVVARLPSLKAPAQNGTLSSFGGNNILKKNKKKKPLQQLFPLLRFDGRTNKLRFTRKTNKLYLSLGQLGRNGEMKDRSIEGRRRQAGEKEMKQAHKQTPV